MVDEPVEQQHSPPTLYEIYICMTVTSSKFYEVSFVEALQNTFILKKIKDIFLNKTSFSLFCLYNPWLRASLAHTLST